MLSDQDTGFENKARVRKLPLQVFTAPDAQKLETEKQNKKETEASLNADNDTYNGLECSQEQIELVLREKEKILEEARKEAAAIEQEANEKALLYLDHFEGTTRHGETIGGAIPGGDTLQSTKGWEI